MTMMTRRASRRAMPRGRIQPRSVSLAPLRTEIACSGMRMTESRLDAYSYNDRNELTNAVKNATLNEYAEDVCAGRRGQDERSGSMKKKIVFAALAAAFAVCASGQCMDESALAWRDGAQTADDMMFLGVDLRHVPQWDGDVIGVAHGEKGCVPIRYRTKEVKLAFPFIGFKSMTLCSCYLTGCNCDPLGVRSVHLKRRESAGNGVFDEKKARQWLEVAANAIRDKFGVDMKLECESERVIAMIGENDCLQFYCSVCLGKIETSDGWSSEVIKTHAMMYNLYVNKKGCKGPEHAPRPSETQEIEVEVDI